MQIFNKDQVAFGLRNLETNKSFKAPDAKTDSNEFMHYLKESIQNLNSIEKNSDQIATDVAIGKSNNLQEAMISMSQAELSFNFAVQVRNKALEAYQDIMKMPV